MSSIEIQGVSSLESFLASSEVLEPHLLKNDKTKSWDGSIFVFDKKIAKKYFFGNVPVQVKSKQVTEFSKKNIRSQNFSLTDLENYFKDGGILIFVVEINKKNDSKIFISNLLPSDLKIILTEVKQKEQTYKSINLEYLPKENIGRIESICKNFVINRNKQMSIKNLSPIPMTEANELLISGVTDERPFDQYLLNVPQYVYTRKNKEELELFVGKVNINQLKTKINENVTIYDEVFFKNIEVITNKDSTLINFGNEISFNITTSKLTFKISGNLEEQILTNKFLVKVLKEKVLFIGEKKIELQEINNGSKIIEQVSERYSKLKDIEAFLNIFSIENNKFELDKFLEVHNKVLQLFIDSMVYEKKILNIPFNVGIQGIKIGNLVLGIIVYKADDNYRILNLFDKNLNLQFFLGENKPEVQSSPYIDLKADLLIKLDNLDVNVIIQNVKNIEYSELYAIHLNFLLLEFIKAFDETNSKKFIDTAGDIVEWLVVNDPKNQIYILNKYQIIRRLRGFKKEEIDTLMFMKKNAENEVQCAISILLENKSDVGFYLSTLSKEIKEKFLDYPIYSLALKLSLIESLTYDN